MQYCCKPERFGKAGYLTLESCFALPVFYLWSKTEHAGKKDSCVKTNICQVNKLKISKAKRSLYRLHATSGWGSRLHLRGREGAKVLHINMLTESRTKATYAGDKRWKKSRTEKAEWQVIAGQENNFCFSVALTNPQCHKDNMAEPTGPTERQRAIQSLFQLQRVNQKKANMFDCTPSGI